MEGDEKMKLGKMEKGLHYGMSNVKICDLLYYYNIYNS